MNKSIEMTLVLAFIAVSGLVGAWTSKLVKDGASVLVYYVAGMTSIASWAYMIRRSPWNLLVSAVLWDVFYQAAWFITTIFIADDVGSKYQIIGCVIVVIGLIFMHF